MSLSFLEYSLFVELLTNFHIEYNALEKNKTKNAIYCRLLEMSTFNNAEDENEYIRRVEYKLFDIVKQILNRESRINIKQYTNCYQIGNVLTPFYNNIENVNFSNLSLSIEDKHIITGKVYNMYYYEDMNIIFYIRYNILNTDENFYTLKNEFKTKSIRTSLILAYLNENTINDDTDLINNFDTCPEIKFVVANKNLLDSLPSNLRG